MTKNKHRSETWLFFTALSTGLSLTLLVEPEVEPHTSIDSVVKKNRGIVLFGDEFYISVGTPEHLSNYPISFVAWHF